MGDSKGRHLGSPPAFWDFTPEQVKNPANLVKCLEKCAAALTIPERQKSLQCAAGWSLANEPCPKLFSTQREENVPGSAKNTTGTVATPSLATGTAAAPRNQLGPVSVTLYTRGNAESQLA